MSFTTNGNMHRHARIHGKEGGGGMTSHSTALANHNKEHTNVGAKRQRRVRNPMQLMPLSMQHTHLQTPGGGSVKRKHDVMEEVSLSNDSLTLSHHAPDEYQLQTIMNTNQQPVIVVPEVSVSEDDTETLRCPICLKTFMCKYGLDTHFECHSKDVARCQICQLKLSSVRLVYFHYFVAHVDRAKLPEFANQFNRPLNGITPLTQGFHDLTFSDFSIEKFAHIAKVWCEKNKRRPISISHNYYCKKCDHAFPSEDVLRMHLAMHPHICDVTCQACDVTFASKQEFEDHVIQHGSEKVIESYSKLIGVEDSDVQEVISQHEFLLCLGLKSVKSSTDWCNNNAIESAASKFENQLVPPPPAVPAPVKPINTVQPIVIEPKADHLILKKIPKPSMTIKPQQQQVLNAHPAFPASRLYSDMIGQRLIQPLKAVAMEISNTSDGEITTVDTSDTVKPYQCVICEFAFPSLYLCESHCRSDHNLMTNNELHSAIKLNPLSGQRKINPALSVMPYLCKKCTNGFTTKNNCIKHIVHQHRVQAQSVGQHIATNKRLNDGNLQPYLAGMKDAKDFIKNSTKIKEKIATERSAFYPPPTHRPIYTGNTSTYITSPPIDDLQIKQEPGEIDQPLDFSVKKEATPCDFSAKSSSAAHVQNKMADESGCELPMDLSVRAVPPPPPSHNDYSTSMLASSNNVVTMSSSSSSSSSSPTPQFLSSMSSALQPINVRARSARVSSSSITSHVHSLSSQSNTPTAATSAASSGGGGGGGDTPIDGSSSSPFIAPIALAPPPLPPFPIITHQPLHANNLQQCYVVGLGKFQCPRCCLLFKTSYQVQC